MATMTIARMNELPSVLQTNTFYLISKSPGLFSITIVGNDITNPYVMDNVSMTDVANAISVTTLTGLLTTDDTAVVETDTFVKAFGKLQAQMNTKASLNSPALTGVPTAPTAPSGTSDDTIASTKFVADLVAANSLNPAIIGPDVDQIPLNQHLGELAYVNTVDSFTVSLSEKAINTGDAYFLYVSDTQVDLRFKGLDGTIRTLTSFKEA